MSTSPREREAGVQLDYLRRLAPDISKPTFDFEKTLQRVLAGIDTSTAITTSSLSQALGSQLAASGVAGGQPRAESFISALAPVYAGASEQKARTTSELAQFAAQNELLARQLLATITGQQGNLIGMLKDSSTLGDVLGTLGLGAEVIAAIYGIPGVSAGLGKMFGGGQQLDLRRVMPQIFDIPTLTPRVR